MKKPKRKNLVAKHAATFNSSVVHLDKKRAKKKGYRKHKGQEYSQAA